MICSTSFSSFSTISCNTYNYASIPKGPDLNLFQGPGEKTKCDIFEEILGDRSLKDIEELFEDAHRKHATQSQIILLYFYSCKMPRDHENFQKLMTLFKKFLSQDFKLGSEDTIFGDHLQDDNLDFLVDLASLWIGSRKFEYLYFDPFIQLIEKVNSTNVAQGSVRFHNEILEYFDQLAITYNHTNRRKALVAHEVFLAIAEHKYMDAFEIYKNRKSAGMCIDTEIDEKCKKKLAEIAVLEGLRDVYASKAANDPLQLHLELAHAALDFKKFDLYTEHALALFDLGNYTHSYYLGALAQRLELGKPAENDATVSVAIKDRVRCHSSEEYWRLGSSFLSDFQCQCQVAYGRVLWRKNEQKKAMEYWRAAACKNNAIANYYLNLLSFDKSKRKSAKLYEEPNSVPNHLRTVFDDKEKKDSAYLNKSFFERKKIWVKQHGFKATISSVMRFIGKIATLAVKYFLYISAATTLGVGGVAFGIVTPFFGFPILGSMAVCVAGIGAAIALTTGIYYFTHLFNLKQQYVHVFGDPQQRWFPNHEVYTQTNGVVA